MCGIVGVLMNGPAAPVMLEALRRLEYRGYDSAGLATIEDGSLQRRRAAGRISALSQLLESEPLAGKIGIGHTRWATHGAASQHNAHPHRSGPVVVVHNGIIENWRALRDELTTEGCVFESDTDSEVIAHLCATMLGRGLDPRQASMETISRLVGAYALCLLFEGAEDMMICARRGSPLAIGYGQGEMFVGSDALALGPLTDRISYLADGDCAVLTRAGAEIFDADGTPVQRPVQTVPMEAVLVDKAGYRHFMAKEIHEQPTVTGYALARHLSADRRHVVSAAAAIDWRALPRLTVAACGTAFYAAQVAKWWFETIARLPVDVEIASEFRYRQPPMTEGGATLVVSQSGETADTLAALRYAKSAGQTVLGVVNVENSTIAREADMAIPIHAGPEIGVASTKAFTTQLIALACLAIHAARARQTITPEKAADLIDTLSSAPRLIAETIALEDQIAAAAADLAPAESALFIGRGTMHALALEGALKLKELTYIHAEGHAAGELKHGPIALVDATRPIVALAPHDELFEKTASNMSEVAARGGRILLVTDRNGAAVAGAEADRTLILPDVPDFVAPLVYAIPVQLLAYHAAVLRGTDVDQPRNLAKSVTVE